MSRVLKELATLVPGINPTRAEKQFGVIKLNYYDKVAFEIDYNRDETDAEIINNSLLDEHLLLNEGDVIINNSLQLATIVGKSNVGKVLSLNFTKLELDSERLDKMYFLYLFNENKSIRQQKKIGLQGIGPVRRIPLKALGEIIVPIIPLGEQKKIGEIYSESLRLQNRLKKYGELMERFTYSMIEENLERGRMNEA